ncbi:MAG: hypothetical protein KBC06_00510 [Candidatus Pacebacteria bacterium]|nr:hypothetical protein [Candidatus Paceibacterota bacterium]
MHKKFGFIFLPIFFLFIFVSQLNVAQAATSTKSTASTTTTPVENKNTNTGNNKQIEEIKTIVGKNTPGFLSKPIIWFVNFLEDFRKNSFNNVFIFYGLFFVALFMILRSIWRFFF